jgi:hypothetical protein
MTTARDAKEFLVNKIVEEAEREGVLLSDVERKMLYFSETGWTLPDMMEVNEAFDREYDQAAYESKIKKLVNQLLANARASDENSASWNEAVRTLKQEDHYILVMVDGATASKRPPGDMLKLVATALAVVCGLLAIVYLANR